MLFGRRMLCLLGVQAEAARRFRNRAKSRGRTMSLNSTSAPHWEEILVHRLMHFGHRNWIVIADSAYPAQSNSGIETIATGAGHLEVLGKTLRAIADCKHLRAKVLVDAELKSVAECDAPGATAVRQGLYQLLGHQDARELDHELILSM